MISYLFLGANRDTKGPNTSDGIYYADVPSHNTRLTQDSTSNVLTSAT